MTALEQLEEIVDRSKVTGLIEEKMPSGGRPRQLPVRTLILGVLLALCDGRPAQLCRVHKALVSLSVFDQLRLRVESGGHLLTYRQVERTFALFTKVLALKDGDHELVERFSALLIEASVPERYNKTSSSFAVDWTDHPSWSRPRDNTAAPDPDARWGHNNPNVPGQKKGPFFGYYAQAVTQVKGDGERPLPELIRRVCLWPCDVDPPKAALVVIDEMVSSGIKVTDLLCDIGYSFRSAKNWADPLRRLGIAQVCDVHPEDRGLKGAYLGALIANGNLYCPATPTALLSLGPPSRGANKEELKSNDAAQEELARYKFVRIQRDDEDGYHRVACPASEGKLRCPVKEHSLSLSYSRPEIFRPPSPLPTCCLQRTITVAPAVNAKTRQKHDYASKAHRISYARRTAAERVFASLKDPSTTNVRRGWCRLMGRVKNLVMYALAAVVRNVRIVENFERERRAPTPTRQRRRLRIGS